MSKIIQAVNSMIASKDKISNVRWVEDTEFVLFLFNGKHKWAIRQLNNDDYTLTYFKTDLSIDELADINSWENEATVRYSAKELGTKEALVSFRELNQIVQEKVLGIDEALDDIIGKKTWS